MKQRITVRELNKLTDGQKQQLREWWKPKEGDFVAWENLITAPFGWRTFVATPHDMQLIYQGGHFPLLSIGQMIELIQEKKPLLKSISKARFDKWIVNIDTATLGHKDELCDSLWEATTRVLKDVE